MGIMRRSGVLTPIFSLPARGGIGTLGPGAYDFVDFLARAGQSLWQILPIGPIDTDNSPYSGLSAFAGNPLLIDPALLHTDGLLSSKELDAYYAHFDGTNPARVDYACVRKYKIPLLFQAAIRLGERSTDYKRFCEKNAWWLDDFTWLNWDRQDETESDAAQKTARGARHEAAGRAQTAKYRAPDSDVPSLYAHPRFTKQIQYLFFTQWDALKRCANARGVGMIGDLPFYVSERSSDFAAHPELFQLVRSGGYKGKPAAYAGVPPDAFSADGQAWNMPVYAWSRHKADNYAWWFARLRQAAELYDLCRIDHFRGLSEYFSIPVGAPAAAGTWKRGPGEDFINAVKRNVPGVQIIAEDLGVLTESVNALLRHSGFPGMKVLQFAFEPQVDTAYLPHNHYSNCVVYTGTHDNNTIKGWIRESDPDVIKYACEYFNVRGSGALHRTMIRAAQASVADTVVIPVQDWLGLGKEARINTPSTVNEKNWSFRLQPDWLTEDLAAVMYGDAKIYGRIRE